MVFHAHCLNPFSFTTDYGTFFEGLLDVGIEFPLERLHTLIKTGMSFDKESELQWNTYHLAQGHDTTMIPYQLCNELPFTLSDMNSWKAADIYVTCPQCKIDAVCDLASFTAMRLEERLSNCSICDKSSAFSTNLVSASLRQRGFAEKMANEWFLGLDSPSNLEKATARYRRFMFVDLDMDAENGIVPTSDIDLIWHTHQLFPVEYRKWCFENLNRYVNHDDTVAESDLAVGLEQTVDIWQEKYGEEYEVDYFRVALPGPMGPPAANYCEYGPSCWPVHTSSENGCVPITEEAQLLSCRYRCGKCAKTDCHKPSRPMGQFLSCRYRCGKCSKADCHKPSRPMGQFQKSGYSETGAKANEAHYTPPIVPRLISL
jgi:Glycine-rich domain-containing protein-like